MSMFSLEQVAAIFAEAGVAVDVVGQPAGNGVGNLMGDVAHVSFDRVSTDSRTAGAGDLFVALAGERYDAHDFLPGLAERGVAAVLVARLPASWQVPALRVADPRAALGALARGWRRRFALPLVAVTGSNGKTTVKEMIAGIFAASVGEEQRLATRGNFNNDVGLPLTLLRLTAAHRLAVVELGMNHPGETSVLARLAEPTIALVNNAQREHQEFMATVEAVALEHASVIHALPRDGTAIFPADDAYAGIWRVAATGNPIVDFALHSAPAAASATSQFASQSTVQSASQSTAQPGVAAASPSGGRPARHETSPPVPVNPPAAVVGTPLADGTLKIDTAAGSIVVALRILGQHNQRNALAASAAALAAGVPLAAIKAGLEAFEPVKGRLQVKIATLAPLAGATVIDDTYNANPDSMRAAIDVLAARPTPRLLVIGDMGEVGDHGVAFHREIGDHARARGIDALFALGAATRDACTAFGAGAQHFDTIDTLLAALCATRPAAAPPGASATILVKGSRFMALERVVDRLVGTSPANTRPGVTPGAH